MEDRLVPLKAFKGIKDIFKERKETLKKVSLKKVDLINSYYNIKEIS